jgi:hypothetical protein
MEKIIKAMQTCAMLREELRDIHRAADPFGEIVALQMIEEIAALQNKLNRYADAARQSQEVQS